MYLYGQPYTLRNTPIQRKPEVAWKRGLRALVSKKMASAQASRKISHKCCAAALCNNRSENRPDLIYFSFPSDENLRRIWNQKMKRGDTKFAQFKHITILLFRTFQEGYRLQDP